MKAINRIYYIFFILLILTSCNEGKVRTNIEYVSTLNNRWNFAGEYIKFQNNSTLIYRCCDLYLNYADTFKYRIDSSNRLFFDTSYYGKIKKWNSELLLIENKESEQIAFMPLTQRKNRIDSVELIKILTNCDWTMKDRYGESRYDFRDESYFSYNNGVRYFVRRVEENDRFLMYGEMWGVKEINNNLLLIVSLDQMNFQYYNIENIKDSLILASTITYDSIDSIEFKAIPSLTKIKYENRRNMLIGCWKLKDYSFHSDSLIDFDEQEIIPTSSTYRKFRPYREEDSVPMIIEDFYKEKKIEYLFNENGTCTMKYGNSILREANWKLSNDGEYINMHGGWMHSMKIVIINDSELEIKKQETIEYINRRFWRDRYLLEKLEKTTTQQCI
ncbi:MAG: hypothetical protein AB7S69_14645 [Salinivirgaceae bacterium]